MNSKKLSVRNPQKTSVKKLILIDGYAILHRAYHALPPLTNRRGQLVNAIYGFVSILLKLIVDLKPTHIVVAFDREEKTFRREKYEAYQAKRKPIDFGLSQQFAMARDLVKAFNIPSYELARYESDDIIGTISKRVKDLEIIIVTGDRDLFQLVDNRVQVYMPSKGVTEGKIYKKADVVKKMGVAPSKIVDYKALVGDPADNYPGVSGIGPKTAISLIEKYGSLKGIYEHLKEIPEKVAQKLREGKQYAILSYELAQIITDCRIDFKLEDAQSWDVDSEEVLKLFEEFGFTTLTERVKKVGGQLDEEKQMSLL